MAKQTIVWIAGIGWDGVPGTDRRMVEAISITHHVLWVDPPVPPRNLDDVGLMGRRGYSQEQVARNVLRLATPVLPGVTRPGIRRITAFLLDRAIRAALAQNGLEARAVVVAFPLARFPAGTGGRRVLYVTDDWLEGSALMGFSRKAVKRALVDNMAAAHIIATVSEYLLRGLPAARGGPQGQTFAVIPNGCLEPGHPPTLPTRHATAGLVGQLNERLDLDVLEAVQATGVSITVIGPRADRSPLFKRRLDRFLAAENVEWLGRLQPDDLAARLVHFGVGLTPYADSTFNRASFPLKTLEYLAAGVPVVSTDIPSARWLNSEHVAVSTSPGAFAQNVLAAVSQAQDTARSRLRRDFAAEHSWTTRANHLMDLLEAPAPGSPT